jgi:hypothetical protein
MLEFIGFIALVYLAFKFLPDFLMFLVKLTVGIIVIIMFLNILAIIFPLAFIPFIMVL